MDKESNLDVRVGRTEAFESTTLAVSNYLDSLPITVEQNNKLIELICRNITAAEQGALSFGITIAGAAAAYAAKENRQPEEKDFLKAAKEYGALESEARA